MERVAVGAFQVTWMHMTHNEASCRPLAHHHAGVVHYLAMLPDLGCLALDGPELKPRVPFSSPFIPTPMSTCTSVPGNNLRGN